MAHRVHPGPRLRQHAAQRGDEAEQQERQREAETEPNEDRERGERRQDQRRAERAGHERAGAGRRDKGGEHAGPEGRGGALPARQAFADADDIELEQPGEVEADRGDEQEQQQDDAWIL